LEFALLSSYKQPFGSLIVKRGNLQKKYLLLRKLPQKVNAKLLAFIGEVFYLNRKIFFFGICFVVLT
jgi:hypothetical protein